MAFDACEYSIKMVVIRAAALIREAKGLPETKDTNTLYNEVAHLFHLAPMLPAIMQVCPRCSQKAYLLHSMCKDCKDSENGKYKSAFRCQACGYEKKSEEPVVVWLNRFGLNYGAQTKESLGIKTITDKGVV